MEQFISMIATGSIFQFYFFKMVFHQQPGHQSKEKGLIHFEIDPFVILIF